MTCINGPYDDIHLPRVSETLDYEGELAIIVGRRCRHVSGPDARNVTAGFTICNERARMANARIHHDAGKVLRHTHGPIGPWICTPDELPGIHDLSIKTWVSDELRQNGSTSEFIYRFGEMLVELSTAFTLEPGDILTTGSPAGVGCTMKPPRYLKVGDVSRVEIEGIGHIASGCSQMSFQPRKAPSTSS